MIYSNNSEDNFKLRNKEIKWIPDCINELVSRRNLICIEYYDDGKVAVEKYRNPDGSPVMYVANSPINCDHSFYVFEPASPYVKRFTSIMRRVHSSGIKRHSLNAYFGFKSQIEKFEVSEMKHEDITNHLIFISVFGCICASFLLIAELLIAKRKK